MTSGEPCSGRGGRREPRLAASLGTVALALWLLGAPLPSHGQTAEGQRWAFSATVGESYSDNLLLLSPDSPGDTVDRLSVGLLYGRSAARFGFSAYGRISGKRYRTFNQFSGLDYGGGVGGSYRPSPRVALQFGQALSSGFYTPFLIGLGIQAPQVEVDVARTTALGTFLVSPRTTVKLDGEFAYLAYRSDLSTLDASQLPIDALLLVGVVSPEEATTGLTGLPTPVDGSLSALGAFAAEGVSRRRLNLVTFRPGLQVSQTLTPKTSVSFQLGYRGLDFNNTDLGGGGQLDTGATIRQSLSPTTNATLQYTYQRNTAQVPAVTTQTLLLQAEGDLSPHLKVDGSVGFGLTGAAVGASSAGTSLLGGAGISGRHRRTRYDARYGRSVFQGLGFGRNYLTDYASASVDHTFTKRLSARIEGRYRHSQDALTQQFSFTSQAYWLQGRYRIQRRTVVGIDYVFRRIDPSLSQPAFNSSSWGFFLGYNRVWK